ncbi:MAG: GlmU family protein [Vicingus serpentipes]|nr:GlmU family protein [Vicingus serpentipes]
MNIVFFEENRTAFLPLVYTKPIAKLRVGILTIEEKWKHFLAQAGEQTPHFSYLTEEYLSDKFPLELQQENLFINSSFCPTEKTIELLMNDLEAQEAITYKDTVVLARCSIEEFKAKSYNLKKTDQPFFGIQLEKTVDLFTKNAIAIELDYQLLTAGRVSQEISITNTIIGNKVFLEEGAKVEAAILNSNEGPIYIGKNAEVMEGSIIRGAFALCEGAVLKLGAKVYGPTTVGKYSKVGGEVNNVVMQDYSNKGHDGFLGNSVVGEWCNLGADTNTSNLKNNYSEVKLWSYTESEYQGTGLTFCGLIMGDHSKCGINTMFNTGTVVGVNANIFGGDFPSKFISSYSWGGAKGFTTYDLEKSFEVAEKVMERRGIELTTKDKKILTAIFEMTAKYRK